MFASAGFSFVLYLLVFFQLRGNITLSGGYKIHFHKRPKVRVGRTNDGAYIVTDDRRVESHLTTVGKQMLWHPIAYTILVLPFAIARYSSFSGGSVPFSVTTFTAAIFVLGGFVNAVLFCITRNVLTERWKRRLSIGTTLDSGQGDASLRSRTSSARPQVEYSVKKVVGTAMDLGVIDIHSEKDVEIQYENRDRSPSTLRFSPPTPPLRAHGGRQRADSESYHSRHLSFSPLRNATLSIRGGIDEDSESYYSRRLSFSPVRNATLSIRGGVDGGSDPSFHPFDTSLPIGVRSASKAKGVVKQVPDKLVHPSHQQESAIQESPPGLEVPASFHPFDMGPPVEADPRNARPNSILTFETAVYQTDSNHSWGSGDFGGYGRGIRWMGHKGPTQQMDISSPAVDRHPYAMPYPGAESRRLSGLE